jgi:hypothetical protein
MIQIRVSNGGLLYYTVSIPWRRGGILHFLFAHWAIGPSRCILISPGTAAAICSYLIFEIAIVAHGGPSGPSSRRLRDTRSVSQQRLAERFPQPPSGELARTFLALLSAHCCRERKENKNVKDLLTAEGMCSYRRASATESGQPRLLTSVLAARSAASGSAQAWAWARGAPRRRVTWASTRLAEQTWTDRLERAGARASAPMSGPAPKSTASEEQTLGDRSARAGDHLTLALAPAAISAVQAAASGRTSVWKASRLMTAGRAPLQAVPQAARRSVGEARLAVRQQRPDRQEVAVSAGVPLRGVPPAIRSVSPGQQGVAVPPQQAFVRPGACDNPSACHAFSGLPKLVAANLGKAWRATPYCLWRH